MFFTAIHTKKSRDLSGDVVSGQTLWSAFKEGDEEAYARIYEDHFDALYDYCEKITRKSDLIEDCIHDLFISLWKNKENLVVPQSIRAYLLSAIRRIIFRKIKKERKYTHLTNFCFFEEALFESSREDKIINKQIKAYNHQSLIKALKQLTNRQKEAIHLRFYHNLDYADVASVMNITLEAVYNHISKGIGKLKETLKHSAIP